eukprot:scaffold14.g1144.t1
MGLARVLLDGAASSDRSRARGLRQAHMQLFDRLPASWSEHEYDLKAFDKVFACEWLDSRHVLMGTKCNKLLQLDTGSGRIAERVLPNTPARAWSAPANGWGPCGIHAVKINPARDMVATGGRDPTDAVVLRLADGAPVQMLVGHMDWIFGLAWVSDRHLVTGSRDQSVAIWQVPEGQAGDPVVQVKQFEDKGSMKRKFDGKVRDVAFSAELGRLAALDTSGCVKMLDPARDLATARVVKLEHKKELVCLALRRDLLAVGSAAHVNLADPRARAHTGAVASPDEQHGVRSVALQDHLLSFGTGRGKICFYDLRASKLVPTEPAQQYSYGPVGLASKLALQPPPPVLEARHHLQTGQGWLLENDVFFDHFSGTAIHNACYAHAWDPSRTRLFACGGPLAYGLKGSYAALFQ